MKQTTSVRDSDHVLIGREVLPSIGLDNKMLMAAACDRQNGVTNIPEMLARLPKEETKGPVASSIHSLLQLRDAFGTFHSQGGPEKDSMGDSDVYVDIGEEPVEDPEAALESRVKNTRSAG